MNKVILTNGGLTSSKPAPDGFQYLGLDSSGNISYQIGGTISQIGGGSSEWLTTNIDLTETEISTLGSVPVEILPDITSIPALTGVYYNIRKITVAYLADSIWSGLTDDNYLAFIQSNNNWGTFDRAMLSNPSTSGWFTEIVAPTFNRNYSTNDKNKNPSYVRKMNYFDGFTSYLNQTKLTLRCVKATSPFYTDPSFLGISAKMKITVEYKIVYVDFS